jgi:hypothetical protein
VCLAERPLRRQPNRSRAERALRIGRLGADLLGEVVGKADKERCGALSRCGLTPEQDDGGAADDKDAKAADQVKVPRIPIPGGSDACERG